ncbi:hypothetical protein K0M31_014408, partial [Melipona bicolor]
WPIKKRKGKEWWLWGYQLVSLKQGTKRQTGLEGRSGFRDTHLPPPLGIPLNTVERFDSTLFKHGGRNSCPPRKAKKRLEKVAHGTFINYE